MKFTSLYVDDDKLLAKRFSKVDGEIKTDAIPNQKIMYAEQIGFDTLNEFNQYLEEIESNTCLVYGIADQDGLILSRKNLEKYKTSIYTNDLFSRTRHYFRWYEGSSILMLDYDPRDTNALSLQEVYDAIINILPALKKAPILVRHSSSSFIKDQETGEYYKQEGGKRVYISVKNRI